MNIQEILSGYNTEELTIGALGGHSGLDVAHGAYGVGFKSVIVAKEGREKTYEHYLHREEGTNYERGCIDEIIVRPSFENILDEDVQKRLLELNTLFVHNRYFWVYFSDFSRVEKELQVPIFGSRTLLKIEERDQPYNQYHLLDDAGIRIPKMFATPADIDRPCLVKASEKGREYERAFFVVHSADDYEQKGSELEAQGKVGPDWRDATIEEFVVGAPVNFNFFYSPLTQELELVGTDTRRQTNLDGFLRMTAPQQVEALKHVPFKMIETGHIACTIKESLIEKALDLGQNFVDQCKKLPTELDPSKKGIIGPFALQGAVVAEEGREDIVIFDVSFRIPGSPGTRSTPYSGYLWGDSMSVGERIALELRRAVEEDRLLDVLT